MKNKKKKDIEEKYSFSDLLDNRSNFFFIVLI